MKTIKHIMYLLAAGCLVFCMSCSNDDTDTSSQQKNIAFTQAGQMRPMALSML